MDEKLMFETFEDFCKRANDILHTFEKELNKKTISIVEYKKYIYENHKFSDNRERDMMAKDKCWNWIMSYKYEPMSKNDLYCVLGQMKKY